MRFTILVAVVAVLAALCARTLSNAPPICPHDPHACYFSDGYSSARARFRAAALGANATLHTLSLPTGKDLTIDVAVLSSGTEAHDPPTLVHLSGTHGVEAYAGSAVQLALLERWLGLGLGLGLGLANPNPNPNLNPHPHPNPNPKPGVTSRVSSACTTW